MNGFAENIELPVAYLKTLTLENVRSFKKENKILFSTNDERPIQWTVILGNNNTGKTTMLKCIAGLYWRTEKATSTFSSENLMSDEHERTVEEEYVLTPHKLLLDLLTDSYGEYGVDFLTKGQFNPIVIDKKTQKSLLTRPFCRVGLGTFNGEYGFFADTGHPHMKHIFLQGYSTQRKTSESSLSEQENIETVQSFFSNNFELINVEEWLLQINYASKNDDSPKAVRERAKRIEKRVREVITSEILPDIQDFRFRSTSDFKNYIEFQTDYGWVRLKDLGYGYQATLAWVMDLAKRMFDRYPTSKNPLAEPAVVLVDEIDLHLHPEWQRKIISYLSNIFKNTQFIVTAHSPLVVQSAENVNLVMLEKDGDHINIRQQFGSFKGWTVDEILTELMGMDDKTMSDTYLDLMKQFDEALDEDNYEKAQSAYEGLDKILHPSSSQRKILRIQMSSLAPVEA
jgi:predicted ATP-binding protein involved in virulence